jgi:hypothetical protein
MTGQTHQDHTLAEATHNRMPVPVAFAGWMAERESARRSEGLPVVGRQPGDVAAWEEGGKRREAQQDRTPETGKGVVRLPFWEILITPDLRSGDPATRRRRNDER